MFPIYGLIHSVDIVRGTEAFDIRGSGIELSEISVYTSRKCRISRYNKAKDTTLPEGLDSEKVWQCLLQYSPNTLNSDFVKVSWGVGPNVAGPLSSGDGWPTTFVIDTPAGEKTLTWDSSLSKYKDFTGVYSLTYTSLWTFADSSESFTYPFTGYTKNNKIFLLDWADLLEDYTITSYTAPAQYYSIVNVRHQQDHVGNYHHTSFIMEYKGLSISG